MPVAPQSGIAPLSPSPPRSPIITQTQSADEKKELIKKQKWAEEESAKITNVKAKEEAKENKSSPDSPQNTPQEDLKAGQTHDTHESDKPKASAPSQSSLDASTSVCTSARVVGAADGDAKMSCKMTKAATKILIKNGGCPTCGKKGTEKALTGPRSVVFEVHHNHILGLTCPTEHDPTPCYPTYTMQLAHVEEVFGDLHSEWCQSHAPARAIFGWGALSCVMRWVIRTHHDRFFKTGDQVRLRSGADFLKQINFGVRDGVPRMFTYTLHEDGVLHFSETGQGFFRDKFSKHAIQARATASVRCAGEFHIQPTAKQEGEDLKDAEHWLVIDNNSGTYAPEQKHLSKLEKLLVSNFPDLRVEALDHDSEVLKKYKTEMATTFGTERCRVRDDPGSAGMAKEDIALHGRVHNLWHSVKHTLPLFKPAVNLPTAMGVTVAMLGAAGVYIVSLP